MNRWYSYYQAEGSNTEATRRRAFNKLTNRSKSLPLSLAAALMCRLALRSGFTMAGDQLASQLISQHMLSALDIPMDRIGIDAAYTVEPILGYAAADVMRDNPEGCLRQLCELTSTSSIQKGPRGELLTKLALVLAFDKASPATWGEKQLFTPVTLLDFLACLAKEPSRSSLAQQKAAQPSKKVQSLSDIGKATCVIAQFVKCEGPNDDIIDPVIKQSIATSTAIEAPPYTADLDVLFACVLDEDKPVSPVNVVLVVAQSKNYTLYEMRDDPGLESYRNRGYTVVYILHECAGGQPFSFTFKNSSVRVNCASAPTLAVALARLTFGGY